MEDGARQRRHRPGGRAASRAPRRWSGRRRGSSASGCRAFGDRYPHQLSGGQRKRVGLAQVLIRDPKILLMDEPFGPLDAQTRQIMGNLLLELWAGDRKAVLFVTHDLEEAIALADRVVIMSAGPGARIIGDHAIDLRPPARCLRGAAAAALPRAAQGDLGPAPRRGAEGLRRRGGMSGGRTKLLVLQALVAVVAIGIWHVGSSVPIGGTYLLPKFFFSTPADVAVRVWTLFADGTAKIVELHRAHRSLAPAQHLRLPASARPCGSTC